MQEHHSEAFDLPDWGTDGAPPPPPPDTDLEDSVEPADLFLDVTPELIRTTTQLPPGYRVRTVVGLVSAEGSATVTDDVSFGGAVAMAKSAALDRLSSEASTSGATAVVGIELTVATRLNDVVVVAYGTALDVRQA
ncbi:MAG: YbjQ family protein [Acidimicrobiia bacterium]|nr:YbjQ family protein [Acidimicrobiia bacterium]